MTNCTLAATGASTLAVVLLALLAIGIGILVLRIARGRGIDGVAVIVALSVAVAALGVVDTRPAGAAVPCSTSSGVAPADLSVGPTTTTASTTTGSTAATSSTTAPTTTGSTATTSSTTAPTTTTTTTVPLPDLTPDVSGPMTASPGVAQTYTVHIANVGQAPTSGVMTVTVVFDIQPALGLLDAVPLGSTDWSYAGTVPGGLAYESNPGFSLAEGEDSTVPIRLTWGPTLGPSGSFVLAATLPAAVGGESNATNNVASHTVVVT